MSEGRSAYGEGGNHGWTQMNTDCPAAVRSQKAEVRIVKSEMRTERITAKNAKRRVRIEQKSEGRGQRLEGRRPDLRPWEFVGN
jgi:hypothetical protein